MDINEMKTFLRIDYDGEDEEIQAFISAAEEYLENAGVKKKEDSPLYDLAVKQLVSNWYSNRIPIGTATQSIEYSLKRILTQLTLGDEEE